MVEKHVENDENAAAEGVVICCKKDCEINRLWKLNNERRKENERKQKKLFPGWYKNYCNIALHINWMKIKKGRKDELQHSYKFNREIIKQTGLKMLEIEWKKLDYEILGTQLKLKTIRFRR